MARSPAEEEDGDASAGSGGWRGRPGFSVGDEVEVRLDGDGFRGAHYVATVAERHPCCGRYQVVYATLVTNDRRRSPLREDVAPTHVRPLPPPPQPGPMFKLFDLVEAYHDEGWWPGVVSAVHRGSRPQYTVTFPLFREEVRLRRSLVRQRREFVCGTWIKAQDVLRGIPLYKEGSSVEVMCDEEKKGTAWMPATIVKMVGAANYVVRYGNWDCSTEVLHSRFIRQQPVSNMKFEYELEPSTEVEVYQDGIWTKGVIADVNISGPRRYGVRTKRPYGSDEGDYLLVSSASLRPYSKWDEQKWSPSSTEKHTRKDVGNKELQLKHCQHLRKDTARSLLNDSMDMETLADTHSKHIAVKSELSNGFRTAMCGENTFISSILPRSISEQAGGRRKHGLPKALASKRKDILSISSLDDVSKTDKKSSYIDVVVISDDSECRNVIEISDNSSSIPNRKKRRMNSDDEIHSTHMLHPYRASRSPTNLLQTHSTHYDPYLEVARHSGEQPCSPVLSHFVLPQEVSGDSSNKDGEQLVPLPDCPVQGLLRMKETEERIQFHHLHSEIASMALDDSAAEDQNPEMCQEVMEGKDKMDGTCREGEHITTLANSKNSNSEIVSPDGEAFPDGKLKPSLPVQQDTNADLLSRPPNCSKRKIRAECTSMWSEEAATFSTDKLEPYLFSQDVKADYLFMQASNDDKMEVKNKRTCMSAKEAPVFHDQTYMNSKKIADVSYIECNASSKHPLSQHQLSISKNSEKPSSLMCHGVTVDLSAFMPLPATSSSTLPVVLSTSSLLLMPEYKMEVFKVLPQKNLHFQEVWNNCPPEFREGQALGLMLSFANMAESIKNMRIHDGPQLYQEKMRSLLDLEDNGFEVGTLKVRLDGLLRLRNHQINLKNVKENLDKEILKLEVANCEVEQRLKLIGMCMTGLGEEPPQIRELTMQKSVNSSYISKLQDELHQVEESLMSVEADFNNAAAAPWSLDAEASVASTLSN